MSLAWRAPSPFKHEHPLAAVHAREEKARVHALRSRQSRGYRGEGRHRVRRPKPVPENLVVGGWVGGWVCRITTWPPVRDPPTKTQLTEIEARRNRRRHRRRRGSQESPIGADKERGLGQAPNSISATPNKLVWYLERGQGRNHKRFGFEVVAISTRRVRGFR